MKLITLEIEGRSTYHDDCTDICAHDLLATGRVHARGPEGPRGRPGNAGAKGPKGTTNKIWFISAPAFLVHSVVVNVLRFTESSLHAI